jgi:uncharacterized membrane protein HdeD (DUF308 family)
MNWNVQTVLAGILAAIGLYILFNPVTVTTLVGGVIPWLLVGAGGIYIVALRLRSRLRPLSMVLPGLVGVLLVYLAFIPFNWREPFENREVLVIFNAMLFAVIALLVGATPVLGADLSERGQTWLRRGVIALAALALAGWPAAVGACAVAALGREVYGRWRRAAPMTRWDWIESALDAGATLGGGAVVLIAASVGL